MSRNMASPCQSAPAPKGLVRSTNDATTTLQRAPEARAGDLVRFVRHARAFIVLGEHVQVHGAQRVVLVDDATSLGVLAAAVFIDERDAIASFRHRDILARGCVCVLRALRVRACYLLAPLLPPFAPSVSPFAPDFPASPVPSLPPASPAVPGLPVEPLLPLGPPFPSP